MSWRRTTLRGLLGALALGIVLFASGCEGLTPDETAAALPSVANRATLQVDEAGLALLAARVLQDESRGVVALELPEGALPLEGGGSLTYGPERWTAPLSTRAITLEDGAIRWSLGVEPGDMPFTILHRAPFAPILRCGVSPGWQEELGLELVLRPALQASGMLALEASTLGLRITLPTLAPAETCPEAFEEAELASVAVVVGEALGAGLKAAAGPLAEALGHTLALSTSFSGVLPGPGASAGRLALSVSAGDPTAVNGLRGVTISTEGVRVPFRVGLEVRGEGRCGPATTTGVDLPAAPPVFSVQGEDPQAAISLALSAELLAALAVSGARVGFSCQALRPPELPDLVVGGAELGLPLGEVADQGAPVSIFLRPGEAPRLELVEGAPRFRLSLRRLALDLYVRAWDADLRALGATADVVVPVLLASAADGSVMLRSSSADEVSVVPRRVTSALLSGGDGLGESLDALYGRALGLALPVVARFPGPTLGDVQLQLVRTRQADGYLYLSLLPR